jgi:hypothetical protein
VLHLIRTDTKVSTAGQRTYFIKGSAVCRKTFMAFHFITKHKVDKALYTLRYFPSRSCVFSTPLMIVVLCRQGGLVAAGPRPRDRFRKKFDFIFSWLHRHFDDHCELISNGIRKYPQRLKSGFVVCVLVVLLTNLVDVLAGKKRSFSFARSHGRKLTRRTDARSNQS